MTRIARGRLFIRDAGMIHDSAQPDDDQRNHLAVGIVEVEAGSVEDDVISGFTLTRDARGLMITMTGARSVPEQHGADSIEGLLRQPAWPKPASTTGLAGGGIALRRTRAPAAAGRETCIAVVAMSVADGTFADAVMVTIAGDDGWTLRLSDPEPAVFLTNGYTPSQILKMPVWGWDGNPWGLYSTLPIAASDCAMRIAALQLRIRTGHADDADRAALAEAEAEDQRIHGGLSSRAHRGDADYSRFREAYEALHGPPDWHRVRTAADQAEDERRIDAIMRTQLGRAA